MPIVDIFPDPEEMKLSTLTLMMCIYGYVLCRASSIIGEGSEMLMLIFGPGIVGGLVVPLLGAIPDCAVILISGMGEGTPQEVQHQLSVGVGTLVGSTIMLLTIPWGMGVWLGRRDYDEEHNCATMHKPKLTHTSLWTNCVTALPDIPPTSRIMVAVRFSLAARRTRACAAFFCYRDAHACALCLFSVLQALTGYLVIQIPSFWYEHDEDGGVSAERPWALACMLFSIACFAAYCALQIFNSHTTEIERRRQEQLRHAQWKSKLDRSLGQQRVQEMVFKMHDKDGSGYIEPEELSHALAHLGLQVGRKDMKELMESIDVGHHEDGDAGKADGRVSLKEFQAAANMWINTGQKGGEQLQRRASLSRMASHRSPRAGESKEPDGKSNYGSVYENKDSARAHQRKLAQSKSGKNGKKKGDDLGGDVDPEAASALLSKNPDNEDEEEDEEEEYWELNDKELLIKAIVLLLFGTLTVTIFSDPVSADVEASTGARCALSRFLQLTLCFFVRICVPDGRCDHPSWRPPVRVPVLRCLHRDSPCRKRRGGVCGHPVCAQENK
jgi:Ca2+/Na+ antiporter